ncbi:magnesium/cobalt transporter CorA [Halobacillus yeomjeoni]|uniref:magnesium/cobalt transporter CorA n=1 Tax=Halobacillus yeomjeoni TaxID=311194 RepID=UPI001CD49257|nr:magnesium/cobalt transporter CorA [Halobacillus yeomjeoni]MCA0983697.1 magnesium/cobalt transporter CorA [Halobacillus yeomjeoni]
MLHVTAYSEDQGLEEKLDLEQLSKGSYDWYWVDFESPTEEEVKLLETHFHFHPLAVEDCLHELQRPKVDYYDDHTFFVTHAINPKTLKREEIDLFVSECAIVTFHKKPAPALEAAKSTLKKTKDMSAVDEFFIFYQVLDNIVDNYFPIVYRIEDHINEIEDNTKDLSMEKLLEELFDRRGELLTLRQTVHPMRDLLYRVMNTHHLDGVRERKEYFADIHDHLIKVADMIASNREMTQDIRDSYLSLNSHQTNRTMQILTVISVIFMPLTFIVGIYGMNFQYIPELQYRYGYFVVWIVMIAIAYAMYRWFKNKGWFE